MSWYSFLDRINRRHVHAVDNVAMELLLQDERNVEIRDKQVWRMTTLIRAELNTHKNKPGDKGSSQGQIRAIGEGIHDEIFRRFHGNFSVIDRALDRAEKSVQDRKGWLEASLSPALQKQYELLIKLAAA